MLRFLPLSDGGCSLVHSFCQSCVHFDFANLAIHMVWGFMIQGCVIGLGELCSKTVLLCYAPLLSTGFIMLLRIVYYAPLYASL